MAREFILLFGPPGVGKSSPREAIEVSLGFEALVSGELFRSDPVLRFKTMGSGLIDDATVNRRLEALFTQHDAPQNFVLDGFSRTLSQAEFLWRFVQKIEGKLLIVVLTARDEICAKRVEDRVRKTPLDKVRPEDHPDVHRGRLKTYHKESKPVIDYFKSVARDAVVEIHCDNLTEYEQERAVLDAVEAAMSLR